MLTGWAQKADRDRPDGMPELSNALQDDLRDKPAGLTTEVSATSG